MIKRILPILLASVAPAVSVAIHPYECHQEIERKCAVGCAELICAAPPARCSGCGSGSLACHQAKVPREGLVDSLAAELAVRVPEVAGGSNTGAGGSSCRSPLSPA